ncbi:FkbM family methyltransferase [Stenotrophomonas sp. ATCM1_4]|uniref:FkbM family methyltransferase n=1 Tax=Stenotrophomonas sp. ATCM1_4 TaxID=2259330 RepID=UPI00104E69EE|nr:FkbM family methyltransferase [Stenotrophomonas sp. ATCM1_4]TDB27290.1 FkbM family methyltransferase [Stenotrophomonas sp. ATCM1_4]
MLPVFHIHALAGEGRDLWLHLQPAPRGISALRLRRRDGKRCVPLDILLEGDAARSRLPGPALLEDTPQRWDVQIEVGNTGQFQQLVGITADGADRHFFCDAVQAHGLSAYLSDSASSLALFTAPLEQHAMTVEAENLRAAFPSLLEQLPLQEDLVLFESFFGRAYAGNPRYIYEALRRMRPDLRCVWAYNGDEQIPGNPQRVIRGSAEYLRLLAQAKYRVNNILFTAHGRKPQTRYLQTWHGTPLKRLGYDITVTGPEVEARDNLYRESRAWTLLLSENRYSSDVLRRAFRYDGPILEAGYPVADPLVAPVSPREDTLARLALPSGHRFVLYAPTWRDSQQVGHWQFDFDLQLDLVKVAAALAPDEILLLRGHHLVSTGLQELTLPANVRDVSQVDDASELCAIADVLITDYSSIFFDYATTGRPILFYCYDLEHYAEQVRGFYLDMAQDLPGPIARSTEELVALLADLPAVQATHADRYAAFRERFCALNDGSAAERVVDAFFGPFPSRSRFLSDLVALAGNGPAEDDARLRGLIQRYLADAEAISTLLYERLSPPEQERFLVWFLKRWAGIDRVAPGELAHYLAEVDRIRAEPRPPITIGDGQYVLQDLRPQGHDFRLASYAWALSIHDILFDQYQSEDFRVRPGEVIIDAGGFIGDTAVLFCAKTGNDCQVHAFELLDENIALFEHNLHLNGVADRVVLNKRALSDHSDGSLLIRQARLQGATSVGAGDGPGERIATITLDDYVAQHGLQRVDLIKMDIEGSEIPALLGAVQTIRRFRPKLALCLYHKWDDVLTIPRFIAGLGIPYRFNFKWVQLPQGWEAVLLAQPCEDPRA